MDWKLDKNKPICPQIYEQICVKIANGDFSGGEKLSSVREIAIEAETNPNTVQKSFENLERDGLIFSKRSTGWFVCEDTTKAKEVIKKIIYEKTSEYISDMEKLGLSKDEIKENIKEWDK